MEKGKFPYIVRTALNNGQKGFIDEDEKYLNNENTLSFGQDTATVFYQRNRYFTGDKIKVLEFKGIDFDCNKALFLVSAITKSFSNFSWGASSYNVDVINNQEIILPTINGNPDYDTMSALISAIKKLVIKDVVEFTNS